jgi:hypothetical protein
VPSNLAAATTVALGEAAIPLLGRANIWVDALDRAAVPVAQAVIQAAVDGTAPGQLEVVVFDQGLSGLAAPFRPLMDSGGEKILRLLGDEADLKAALGHWRAHIQGVNNVIQGETATLVEYRRQVDYPVEGYKLVVLSADFSLLDEGVRTQLGVLFKAGPPAGVSFLVHSLADGVNPFLLKAFERLSPWKGVVEWEGHGPIIGWSPPPARSLTDSATKAVAASAGARVDPIRFRDVQPDDRLWDGSSADGLSFAIGRYGRDIVTLTLGDELNQRHNLLVTGAVGQGKSNLISVIVHSLCQRYAPTELELYLLDFKEGVTLQPFYEHGQYLPHARVLGLEADREFGLSVFRCLHEIYRQRMRQFKAIGVQSISEYRRAEPAAVMPRIVLVVDEFQLMFAERDKVSDEIADLLVKGVRLFRACGIHVVLASQTIGGNMALMGSTGEGLFGQVPIRLALKNSLAESHATLSVKNDAATDLRVGQAIVNQDYGEPQSNCKTSIALADRDDLAARRQRWWENRPPTTTPPSVFEGSAKRSLALDWERLRAVAQTAGPRLFLGSRIEVGARPLDVGFAKEVGRNAAVVGAGEVIPQLQSMVLSLALQRPCHFVIADLLNGHPVWDETKELFLDLLRQAGSTAPVIGKDDLPAAVADLAALVAAGRGAEPTTVIVGLGLDRARDLPPEFPDLLRNGPAAGVHLIGWWQKLESFREQTGPYGGGEANFDIRLALKLDAGSAKQLMADPLLEWRAADNRMIVWDVAELPEAVSAIPYSRLDPETVRALGRPA